MLCACLPSDTIWEQFYQRLELNTDSWSTMQAQQIVCKTIVYKTNKKHIANKDVSADILNYVERTKIKLP